MCVCLCQTIARLMASQGPSCPRSLCLLCEVPNIHCASAHMRQETNHLPRDKKIGYSLQSLWTMTFVAGRWGDWGTGLPRWHGTWFSWSIEEGNCTFMFTVAAVICPEFSTCTLLKLEALLSQQGYRPGKWFPTWEKARAWNKELFAPNHLTG